MNRKKLLLTTGAVLGFAAFALAHHVPLGLSHLSGREILSEVLFLTSSGQFGVPAYKTGATEAPGHHDPVGLVDGDSFTVTDHSGVSETITLQAADFADISAAVVADVVGVINARANLFEAIDTNGYVVLRGQAGGASAMLDIQDGAGAPLSKLGLAGGQAAGANDLEMTISIPDPSLNLAGRTYVVFASATDGSFRLNNRTVPIGWDVLTRGFLKAAASGHAAGFLGTLDGNSDASAVLTASQLQRGFSGGFPDKLYFAYVVFDAGRIAYVSNQFRVDFQ